MDRFLFVSKQVAIAQHNSGLQVTRRWLRSPPSSLSHSVRLQRPTKRERWRAFEQTARYCTDRCLLSTTDRAGEELGTTKELPRIASDRAEK